MSTDLLLVGRSGLDDGGASKPDKARVAEKALTRACNIGSTADTASKVWELLPR